MTKSFENATCMQTFKLSLFHALHCHEELIQDVIARKQ